MRAVVIAALLGLASPARAQPTDDATAAKELYAQAEAALQAGDTATAIRAYGGAYDITKDPVLFYKLGVAHERAGKCPIAIVYYRRYLAEAAPAQSFVETTNARIRACEAAPPTAPTAPAPAPATPTTATPPPAPPSMTPSPAVTATPPAPAAEPAPAAANTALGGFVGGRDAAKPGAPGVVAKHRAAWLFVTGSIAFATVGAVLAYSANSAENDVADLYVGFGGRPPAFDDETRALYDDLVAEGKRYERLAWVSLGLAGATAATAAVLFWRGRHAETITVAPTATPSSAGVQALLRF